MASYSGYSVTMLRTFTEHRYHPDPEQRSAIIPSNVVMSWLFLYNNYHLEHSPGKLTQKRGFPFVLICDSMAVLGQGGDALHVKLVAPEEFRLEQACRRLSLQPKEAREVLKRTDKNRARYHREYYDRDWDDPANYDMVLNTGRLQFDGATSVILAWARERWGLKWEQEPASQ